MAAATTTNSPTTRGGASRPPSAPRARPKARTFFGSIFSLRSHRDSLTAETFATADITTTTHNNNTALKQQVRTSSSFASFSRTLFSLSGRGSGLGLLSRAGITKTSSSRRGSLNTANNSAASPPSSPDGRPKEKDEDREAAASPIPIEYVAMHQQQHFMPHPPPLLVPAFSRDASPNSQPSTTLEGNDHHRPQPALSLLSSSSSMPSFPLETTATQHLLLLLVSASDSNMTTTTVTAPTTPTPETAAAAEHRIPLCSPSSPCSGTDEGVLNLLADRVGSMPIAQALLRIARAGDACSDRQTPCIAQAHSLVFAKQASHDDDSSASSRGGVRGAFRGDKRPKISLERYLARLVRYIDAFNEDAGGSGGEGFPGMGLTSVLGAVVLIDRLKHKYPADFQLDEMNSHRLFMIGTLVAYKFMDDECCSNAYFAGVAGVALTEINKLELDLVLFLDFDVTLRGEDDFAAVWSEFCSGGVADKPELYM